MENKKEIGAYFREQLGEKEIRPTEEVWKTIAATLKKKRRKRFFFWTFLLCLTTAVGIAVFWASYTSNRMETELIPVNDKDELPSVSQETETTAPNPIKQDQNTAITDSIEHLEVVHPGENAPNEGIGTDTNPSDQKTKVTRKTTQEAPKKTKKGKTNQVRTSANTTNANITTIAKRQSTIALSDAEKVSNQKSSVESSSKVTTTEAVSKDTATTNAVKQSGNVTKSNQNRTNTITTSSKQDTNYNASDNKQQAIAASQANKETSIGDKNNARASNKDKTNPIEDNTETKNVSPIPNSEARISKKKPASAEKEIIANKKSKEKEKEKEEEEEEEEELEPNILPGEWTISIHAAPVYQNYIRNTNLLLTDQDISITNDLSYGFGVLMNVPLNDQLLFRFGFNKLRFKYRYNDVTSRIGINGRPSIFNSQHTSFSNIPLALNVRNAIDNGQAFDIEHSITYWELPLELVHSLKGEKARLDVIGGLDIYVFRKDPITLKLTNEDAINIGSSNYFKQQAFGAHIGLGFRYPITNGIQFDLEPTIKYRFGSFTEDVQDQHPIYFGVYSGFTFKL